MIDSTFKGFPEAFNGLTSAQIGTRAPFALGDAFPMPLAVLRDAAIAANMRWMAGFLATTGAALCPHGKTTMSPELLKRQIAAGAWGITAATAHHVRLYRQWGIKRILLANQLVAPGDIRLVLDALEQDPAFEFYCLVDSIAGAAVLADAVSSRKLLRPINVLLEMGALGGRTGVRTVEQGVALAQAIGARSEALALRGVELFEGIYPSSDGGLAKTRTLLDEALALTHGLYEADCFAAGDIVLTGGGSSLFDICEEMLSASDLDGRARVILRSGCYLIHDHGTYARAMAAVRTRRPGVLAAGEGPSPALEVWAVVQSLPEPGLAIASLGKRDVGFDADLPVPIWRYRHGDARPVALDGDLRVTLLYDQHACLAGSADLRIGDLLGFGISHPCTTFDKWRAIATVDEDYRVTGYVTTAF